MRKSEKRLPVPATRGRRLSRLCCAPAAPRQRSRSQLATPPGQSCRAVLRVWRNWAGVELNPALCGPLSASAECASQLARQEI